MTDTRLNHALNHVAISMPAKAMDAATRADIHRFYGEVFGWSPYTPEGEPGDPLVMLMADSRFYLYVSDDEEGAGTVTRPTVDHLGIEVLEERELDAILNRAKAFKEKDDRVTIVEKEVTHHEKGEENLRPDLAATSGDMVNCYIGYILPLQVEIQHFR